MLTPDTYSTALKISYFISMVPMSLVIISALMAGKQMGGTLGDGLKKIASGSIIHTIVILTYIVLERGANGLLDTETIQTFFFVGGTLGSAFLIFGYIQIYNLAKRLKLFTV